MNIAPSPLPTVAPTHEAPRPAQPPVHDSSRPVIAPNPAEAMAQETRRDDERRTSRHAERKIEHDPQPHNQRTRRRTASASTHSATPTEPRPGNVTVGRLLDVFA